MRRCRGNGRIILGIFEGGRFEFGVGGRMKGNKKEREGI